MPRKRYPSDEKSNRQRPHAKVHISARNHPRAAEVFADPEQRGMLVGLWMVAVQSFAAQTEDQVTLTNADIAWLTGRNRRDFGLLALSKLCTSMEYPLSIQPHTVVVTVRNLQRKQGFGSATPPVVRRTPTPPEEPKNQGTKEPSVAPAESAESDHIDVAPLGNMLSKLDGEPDEKLAWLESGVGLEILGSADAEMPDGATPRQRSGKLRQITTARYRTYLKSSREFQGYDEKQRVRQLCEEIQREADEELKRMTERGESIENLHR